MAYEYLTKALGGAITLEGLQDFPKAIQEYEQFMSAGRSMFASKIAESFPKPANDEDVADAGFVSEVAASALQEPAKFAPVWTEVSAERYNEMLGILPPALHTSYGFLVGEACSHRNCKIDGTFTADYAAFITVGKKFYACTENMTRREFKAVNPFNIVITMEAGEPV